MDRERFAEFLREEYPRVVGAVGLLCGDHAVAEDSVCEAMVRAWERLQRDRGIDSLAAWITVVATNHARSRLRRRRAQTRALERLRALHRDAVDPGSLEVALDVWRALQRLPNREREVVVLRFYLDLDIRSIGSALGIAEGTVKTLLSRARNRLAQVVRSEMEPAGEEG
jgi:RNA polymerase sigma-70 factor (ECF subfamily)